MNSKCFWITGLLAALVGCGGGGGGGGAPANVVAGAVVAPGGALASSVLQGGKAQRPLAAIPDGVTVTLVTVDDNGQNPQSTGVTTTTTGGNGSFTLNLPNNLTPGPNVCVIVGNPPTQLSNIVTGTTSENVMTDIRPATTAATDRLYEQARTSGIPVRTLDRSSIRSFIQQVVQEAIANNSEAATGIVQALAQARERIAASTATTAELTRAISSGGTAVTAGTGNLNDALTNLRLAMRDDQLTEADRTALLLAQRHFRDVSLRDTTNARARVGLALTRLALLGLDGRAQSVPTLQRVTNVAQIESTLLFRAVSASEISEALLNPLQAVSSLAGIRSSRVRPSRFQVSATVGNIQNYLSSTIVPELIAIAGEFATASTDEGLSLQISDDTTRNSLRRADVILLEAQIRVVAGFLAQLCSHNLDAGSFYANQQGLRSLDANHDAQVPPSEYFAPSPFGTLRTDGAANLTTALDQLRRAAARAETGIQAKMAEASDPSEIAPVDTMVRADLQNALSVVTGQVIPALNGVYSARIGGMNVNVNISAYFQNPISDLRSVAPTMRLNMTGEPLPTVPTDFPNATLNGVFPNGIPNGLF